MICDMLIMNMPLWINVYLWNKWCLNLESESVPVRNEFSPSIHQSPSGSMTTLLQHLQANSIPKNLQWSESVKWLRIYIIYKNFECLMGMPRGLDGPKTRLCTSTGQCGSSELEMKWISKVVVKLQHPQDFGFPTGVPWLVDGPMTMLLLIYLVQGSIELETGWISPGVVES